MVTELETKQLISRSITLQLNWIVCRMYKLLLQNQSFVSLTTDRRLIFPVQVNRMRMRWDVFWLDNFWFRNYCMQNVKCKIDNMEYNRMKITERKILNIVCRADKYVHLAIHLINCMTIEIEIEIDLMLSIRVQAPHRVQIRVAITHQII